MKKLQKILDFAPCTFYPGRQRPAHREPKRKSNGKEEGKEKEKKGRKEDEKKGRTRRKGRWEEKRGLRWWFCCSSPSIRLVFAQHILLAKVRWEPAIIMRRNGALRSQVRASHTEACFALCQVMCE